MGSRVLLCIEAVKNFILYSMNCTGIIENFMATRGTRSYIINHQPFNPRKISRKDGVTSCKV